MKHPILSAISCAVALLGHAAFAQTQSLPEVQVQASPLNPLLDGPYTIEPDTDLRARTSDTASLLTDIPGVHAYSAGGVSSLPVINGLADDRLRIKVDGMDLIASCPNHMNSPLSYVDPAQLERLTVYPGVAPVSLGGDSIGGTVVAQTRPTVFAQPGEGWVSHGELGASYQSNGSAQRQHLSLSLASEQISVRYQAAHGESDDYHAADHFKTTTATGRPGVELPLDVVGSTAYNTFNQSLGVSFKGDGQRLDLTLSDQDIPYELYPNQRMDMLDNQAQRLNIAYENQQSWGTLSLRLYREQVTHFMDFGPDKQLVYGSLPDLNDPDTSYTVSGMPMYTQSTNQGLVLQGEIPLNPSTTLRTGAELQHYQLDDWWPPAPDCGVGNCIGGMAPLTFWNIHNGERDRKAVFAEWDHQANDRWSTLFGLRFEQVKTNADRVNGYTSPDIPGADTLTKMGIPFGQMYAGSSVSASTTPGATGLDQFNALNRERTDHNWDWTAQGEYRPSDTQTITIGMARKTRSPNLYERYSWSTNTMAMVMNNFVGDGNGYVGNPDLSPEIAHTLSVSSEWRDAAGAWSLQVTPYLTHVKDYIDATRVYPGSTLANQTASTGFVKLTYINQNARLYGLNLSASRQLGQYASGRWDLNALLSYTHGENLETGQPLYNLMPLNLKTRLTHRQGAWHNTLEWVAVSSKTDVSAVRNEIPVAGYSLFNWKTRYTRGAWQVDLGIDNLLNTLYEQPLGGAYTGQGTTMSISGVSWGTVVPGLGRSVYVGVNYTF